ncbi:tetratricopeptide repeat protein [Olleya sp. Bg11-27]|uniref:tetratricopeptide repeat protein n=1 Tax=Olleya sp. Bg11-27 TaxID=2058135 RepID=UPI000C317798|nr:hypothetical protein [Olleya sp. Bg11-27]AUC75480.1 hypothetical protein CW732_07230 [Olleya sp. Bg11-27]
MSLSDNLLKQADNYLEKLLSESESTAFEIELSNNIELQEYLAINKELGIQFDNKGWQFVDASKSPQVKDLEDYFKGEEAQSLKTVLNKVGGNYKDTSKPKGNNNIKRYTFFTIAASVVLLIGLFFLNNNQNIYNDYNSWLELPSLIERGDSESITLQEAEQAFIAKDYLAATTLYSKYLTETKSINTNVYLYLGIAQLELNQNENALSSFDVILKSNSIDFSKGYWYKTLVCLKVEDTNNAIKQLELIVKDSSNYKFSEAEKILKTLKN